MHQQRFYGLRTSLPGGRRRIAIAGPDGLGIVAIMSLPRHVVTGLVFRDQAAPVCAPSSVIHSMMRLLRHPPLTREAIRDEQRRNGAARDQEWICGARFGSVPWYCSSTLSLTVIVHSGEPPSGARFTAVTYHPEMRWRAGMRM